MRLRGAPPLPLLSSFLELNVRTYVTADDKPGIWFFSLDASSPLAVEAARRVYRLPYFRARMSLRRRDGRIDYASTRRDGRGGRRPFAFEASYRAAGGVFQAQRGSLEHFLAERYCLYTTGEGGDLLRGEIHHRPWRLRPAEAEIALNTMAPDDLDVREQEPLLHLAERQDVVVWSLERATR